jgi:DNA ligase-1
MDGERDLFTGFKLATDPLVSFGVAKVARIDIEDEDPGSFTFDDFLDLAGKLQRRALTGHAARDAINEAAQTCHAGTWNTFYRRILLKDLGVGVETKTINKVLGKIAGAHPEANDYLIPVFGCQLAHDGAAPQHAKKIKGRRLLDIKLDGVRLIAILDKQAGTVNLFTRNGKLNENFSEITDALHRLMEALPGSVALDGEVVAGSFQELMTMVNRRDDLDTSAARFALFDMVPLDDFRAGRCEVAQEARHAALSALQMSGMLTKHCDKLVYVIPKVEVELDTPEGQERFSEFNAQAIAAGYEGIMIKDPAAPYVGKRSDAWLKVKPFVEVSLSVTAVLEGEADGKYVGQLGALACEGEDDGRLIRVNVGSGFTDAQRREFWAQGERLIGRICEVRADALTLEAGETVYSLRFPRFKGWRGSEPGEKL